jgi:hypothetical protein
MTKQHKKDPIPENASREELAKFWDTHSVADYWGEELKPVKARFAKNLSHVVGVRLDSETLDKLETQAQKKGVGTTTLIRMWLLEHLEEQEKKQYPPAP